MGILKKDILIRNIISNAGKRYILGTFVLFVLIYLFNIQYTRGQDVNNLQNIIFTLLFFIIFIIKVSDKFLKFLIAYLLLIVIVCELFGFTLLTSFFSEVLFFILILLVVREYYERYLK